MKRISARWRVRIKAIYGLKPLGFHYCEIPEITRFLKGTGFILRKRFRGRLIDI